MRILCVATKLPCPPRDGGRLALWLTLQGLAAAGHEIALVAPANPHATSADLAALRAVCEPMLLPVQPRSWIASGIAALMRGTALTVERHRHAALAEAVADRIARCSPDVVHVEQLQALSHCGAAFAAGVPVLLRMQNVESALWQQAPGLRVEGARLRRDERRAVARVQRVLALTDADAQKLRAIAPSVHHDRIAALAPPLPHTLPAAPARDGAPAVVLAGSGGWWPNTQGARWFVDDVVPLLARHSPQVRVDVFGGRRIARDTLHWHPAPDDAIDAFPAGAIAAVPLFVGSGIRMRILEAWARGLPVVATPVAAAGMHALHGRELLIAQTPQDFADAIARIACAPALAGSLVAAGRAYLQRHHDSAACTDALVAHYRAIAR